MTRTQLLSPLRGWRKSEGYSQERLAELAEVSQGHISQVENGLTAIEGKLKSYLESRASEIRSLEHEQRIFMERMSDERRHTR